MKKESDNDRILREFMLENFCFDSMKEVGFYGKDIKRKDYKMQAERICQRFGYKTVFEYRAKEISGHLSFVGERPLYVNKNGKLKSEPFITVIKSIYE